MSRQDLTAVMIGFAVLALPVVTSAAPLDIRFALEPGVASLHESGVTNWGVVGGGASLSVGLIERLHLTGVFDYKEFPNREPTLSATAIGFGGRYDIDVLWFTPFLELGAAKVYLRAANGGGVYSSSPLDLFFGIGADVRITRWLFGGIVFRYYSVGDTDLFTNPAYATINARLGFVIEAPTTERLSDGSNQDPGRIDNDP